MRQSWFIKTNTYVASIDVKATKVELTVRQCTFFQMRTFQPAEFFSFSPSLIVYSSLRSLPLSLFIPVCVLSLSHCLFQFAFSPSRIVYSSLRSLPLALFIPVCVLSLSHCLFQFAFSPSRIVYSSLRSLPLYMKVSAML